MKRWNKNIFVVVMLVAILVVSLGTTKLYLNITNEQSAEQELKIVTSFFPMYIATENLTAGAEHVSLENLSEPQTGCLHDYQLTPEDMILLSTADVFVVNGGGIEEFLTDVAEEYPELTIIDASEGIELLDGNSHAWMSVALHRQQVENIAEGLEQVDPENASLYHQNAHSYDHELEHLQEDQEALLEQTKDKNIIIFHEAYEYVAQDYDMNPVYLLDLDEERQVSAGEVADVLDAIQKDGVSFVLAEEEYGAEMGEMVTKETGVPVYYLNTLVRGSYDANSYIEKMQENIDVISQAVL